MNPRACLLVSVALLSVGCGRAVSPNPTALGSAPRLMLGESSLGGASQVTVRDAVTGKVLQRLPDGTPAPDWSRYYSVAQVTGASRLTAVDPQTGRVLGQILLPGGFELPVVSEALSSGISPSGEWLALSRQSQTKAGWESDFSVGSSELSQPFTTVSLQGQFEFDAISDDGRSLYLIQRLDDQGHYQVRLYDVAGQTLQPGVIVDKREPNEPMNGIRGDSVAARDGAYVLTVYARSGGPFIHALPLTQPFAWCVDLPTNKGTGMEQQFHWALALTRDGTSLYAVNGVTGQIARLSVSNASAPPAITRVGQIPLTASSSSPLSMFVNTAEAKGAPVGGAALTPDGASLFAVTDGSIAVIDTATLKVRGRYLEHMTVSSIRLSSNGNWLFAAVPGESKVVQLDARTGAIAGELTGINNPWALFWVNAGP